MSISQHRAMVSMLPQGAWYDPAGLPLLRKNNPKIGLNGGVPTGTRGTYDMTVRRAQACTRAASRCDASLALSVLEYPEVSS